MFTTTETVVLYIKGALNIEIAPTVCNTDGLTLPFITYANSAGSSVNTLDGGMAYKDETFVFDIHAVTYEEATRIRDSLESALYNADLLGLVADSESDSAGDNGEVVKSITFSGTFFNGVNINNVTNVTNADTAISSSHAISSSYATSASYVPGVTVTTWDNLVNKPSDIVSSSAQIDFDYIKNKPTISVSSSYSSVAELARTASYFQLPNGLVSGSSIESSSYSDKSQLADSASYYQLPAGLVSQSLQIDYTDIQNKPTTIATASYYNVPSQSFNDITGKPALVSSSAQISYDGITDKPTTIASSISASFATNSTFASTSESSSYANVADLSKTASYYNVPSQSFDDITGKPSLVSGSSQISYTDITDKPAAYVLPEGVVSGSEQISYNDIQDKPTTIATASYYNVPSQSFDDITGKPTLVSSSFQIFNSSGVYSSSLQITFPTQSYQESASYATNASMSMFSTTASFALNAGGGGVSYNDIIAYSGF